MHRRPLRVLLATAALGAGVAAGGIIAGPAVADSASPSTCLTDCTAVFDTAGSTGAFTPQAAVTSLTVTVQGAAGAQATTAGPLAATSVAGSGGDTTVDLGAGYAGTALDYAVGGVGGGSSIARGGSLLVVAGGGGGAGYTGRLDLPDQIFATYPGGDGGSPAGPGIAPGTAGTNPVDAATNGGGGGAAGGSAGAGPDAVGAAGAAPNGSSIVSGGASASLTVLQSNLTGAGGSGYAGGGSGGIHRNILDSDGNPSDAVGAGGGGAGFLAATLSATAGTPNPGAASVTFTYSFSPTAATSATSVAPGDTVPVTIAGLPSNVPFTLVFGGATVGSGTSDAAGAASASFAVPAGQAAGSFPVQVVVGGTVAASTGPVTVVRPVAAVRQVLAETGVTVAAWVLPIAVALVILGVVLLLIRRRRTTRER